MKGANLADGKTNINYYTCAFVSHHAERISIASVKGVNRAILDRRAKLASELSRRPARVGPLGA